MMWQHPSLGSLALVNSLLKLPFLMSRVRKIFDGVGMHRPVQSVARGRTAVQCLICLGHIPHHRICFKVLPLSVSFIAGFAFCILWLLFGQTGDAEI